MTRYLCPDCDDHIMLDQDSLTCIVCKGSYKWVKKNEKIVRKQKGSDGK